jgi:hypothetical protein
VPCLQAEYSEQKVDGKQAVIRNGFLPERTIQTGLGDSGSRYFCESLFAPFLKSSVNRSGALSSGDFSSIILSLFTDVFLVVISIVVDKIPTEYVSLTFCQTPDLIITPEELLGEYSEQKVDGKQAVIRNGFLPERTIQTGLGDIDVQVPKIRDKSKQGIKFNSVLPAIAASND